MSDVSYDQLQKHQFVLITKTGGIAVDEAEDSLIVLVKDGRNWKSDKFALSTIRNVENIKEEYTAPHHLPSRVQGAGGRIGAGLRDDLEHRKAKKNTGLRVSLKSIEKPTVFVNMADDTARSRSFEALSLALEGNLSGQRFQEIPHWAKDLFQGKGVGLTGAKLQTSDDPAMKYVPGATAPKPEDQHGMSSKNLVFLIAGVAALGLHHGKEHSQGDRAPVSGRPTGRI